MLYYIKTKGLPDGSAVKNPPANAGDSGSIPGPRRFHMLWNNWAQPPQLLKLCSRAQDLHLLGPCALEPMLCNKRRHCSEKPIYQNWRVVPAHCNYRKITDAFGLWCWRRRLRVPWTARRSNQSILKEISPGCSLEGLMLKMKLQYFGHLMWRTDSLEKTLMLGRIESRRRSGWQRIRWLDGITD